MALVTNPIIPGFHPDPCVLRVGRDYYVANSTFEWWPGVRIHHSTDLANWRLIGSALTRPAHLDMRGNPDSGGVWAPDLSHADGRFWLVYSDVKSLGSLPKDLRNHLVTAPAIDGPWSDPVPLNASGFDASLYHAEDGRKWLLSQQWDSRPGRNPFRGILLQEFDPAAGRLIGEPVNIFRGTVLGSTEGPHLYRRDGYFYLITAEGGTGWEHAVTVARSRNLAGPYEVSPHGPLLTSRGNARNPLQKAGHASLVETPEGDWYLTHLCSRPVGITRRCILGRETALQALHWPAGEWPILRDGGCEPRITVSVPAGHGTTAGYAPEFSDDFSRTELRHEWSTLREAPAERWLSLTARPGHLRLLGRHSLCSTFSQSLVGFRLLHSRCEAGVTLDYSPAGIHQSAGLALYYNTRHFYYLNITRGEEGGRVAGLHRCLRGRLERVGEDIRLPDTGPVRLGVALDSEACSFTLAAQGGEAVNVGEQLDATLLSDDYVEAGGSWGFTGCFVVLCAQDTGDTGRPADFSGFAYQGL